MEMLLVSTLLAASFAAGAAPTPCADAAAHQFDFWIGDWAVYQNDGHAKLVGHNTIARVDDCALLEHWRGAAGSTGHSLNAYDAQHKVWRQFWVGNDGTVLRLEGALEGRAMVLKGSLGGAAQRITWTPREDGSVRQHWEISSDGAQWKTQFDGIYVIDKNSRAATGGGAASTKGEDADGLSGGS